MVGCCTETSTIDGVCKILSFGISLQHFSVIPVRWYRAAFWTALAAFSHQTIHYSRARNEMNFSFSPTLCSLHIMYEICCPVAFLFLLRTIYLYADSLLLGIFFFTAACHDYYCGNCYDASVSELDVRYMPSRICNRFLVVFAESSALHYSAHTLLFCSKVFSPLHIFMWVFLWFSLHSFWFIAYTSHLYVATTISTYSAVWSRFHSGMQKSTNAFSLPPTLPAIKYIF